MKTLTSTIITLSVLVSGFALALPALASAQTTLYGWQLTTSNTGLAGVGVDRNTLPLYTGSCTPPAGTTITLKKITCAPLLL